MKYLFLFLFFLPFFLFSQKDSTKFFHRQKADTSSLSTRQDAIYQRPTLLLNKTQTAIGGYLEANTNYQSTDKTHEWTMEFRRVNLFLFSAIARRIKFLAEIEFEPAEKEVSVETGMIDFELYPALNVRAGILLAPIGAYNQRHDAPLWEFVDRPLVATEIIPSTLSDMGFGIHGKLYGHNKVFAYDAYLVNGLQEGIVLNNVGRTRLQEGKKAAMFGEDNNNSPTFTGKMSFRHRKIGEVGLSTYAGIYNTYKKEGLVVAPKRWVHIIAVDFNTTLFKKAQINGEFAYNLIQVPDQAKPFFGTKQQGAYIECVYPVLRRKILQYDNATINVGLRAEAVDFNIGKFTDPKAKIYDDVKALTASLSFRPASSTVVKANYRLNWTRDIQGNPVSLTGAVQFGFATYF